MTLATRRPAVLALALVALIAACGGGQTPTGGAGSTAGASSATQPSANPPGQTASGGGGGGTGSTTPACDLLTDADFKEIADRTVSAKNPEPVDTVYQNVCRWNFEEGGEMDLGVLAVGAADRFARTIEFEGAEEIAGLGDRAARLELTGSIIALEGDTMLDLFALGIPDEIEQELIARALENLGG